MRRGWGGPSFTRAEKAFSTVPARTLTPIITRPSFGKAAHWMMPQGALDDAAAQLKAMIRVTLPEEAIQEDAS